MKKLFVVFFITFFFSCQEKSNNLSDLALLQNKSVIFDLNNNILEPKSLYGKKTIINYWATWCGPCIKEMPEIENAQKNFHRFITLCWFLMKTWIKFLILQHQENLI